jgi:hypothetical protein
MNATQATIGRDSFIQSDVGKMIDVSWGISKTIRIDTPTTCAVRPLYFWEFWWYHLRRWWKSLAEKMNWPEVKFYVRSEKDRWKYGSIIWLGTEFRNRDDYGNRLYWFYEFTLTIVNIDFVLMLDWTRDRGCYGFRREFKNVDEYETYQLGQLMKRERYTLRLEAEYAVDLEDLG